VAYVNKKIGILVVMKAVARYAYGPPEVLEVVDVPIPEPKPNEIRIKVAMSSVNRTDSGFLLGKPFVARFFSGVPKPRQPILGCEFAGTVELVGSEVSEFSVGDRVFGFDDAGWGGHGEHKIMRAAKSVVKIPNGVSFEQAAASTEGGHYVLSYLHTMQKLGANRVLVHGATGAIGSAAVQLLKQAGMYVIATSTTKDMKLVVSLGVDRVIDWQKEDFTACGEVVDVVFDAVGKSTFKACKPLLRRKGVYIATELGPKGQNPLLGIVSPLYRLCGAKRALFPLPKNNKALIQYIAERLADKTFVPVIDKTYALEDIADAYRYVLSGQKVGNVLVKVQ
jgi:NADPH:quinone reductase-like Zn-dependent oxidoreductase